jgi:hypothetical protein
MTEREQLFEKVKRARGRVRTLRADLTRLEKWQRRYPNNTERAAWIEAKRRVLRDSEVFLLCVESLYEAAQ